MDGFYDQVNAMNQIDFILAANNTAIMQPFSAGERERLLFTQKNLGYLYPPLFCHFLLQLVSAKNSYKIVPSIKRCTNYLAHCVVVDLQLKTIKSTLFLS